MKLLRRENKQTRINTQLNINLEFIEDVTEINAKTNVLSFLMLTLTSINNDSNNFSPMFNSMQKPYMTLPCPCDSFDQSDHVLLTFQTSVY